MKARCCWCGAGFTRILAHYWCETLTCRVRQAEFGLSFQDPKTERTHYFYVPLPKQCDFELARTPMLLGGGAAGATKSHMARFGLYRRLFQIPGFEALILRKTWNELEKHHLRLMEQEAGKLKALGLPQVEFAKTDREFRVRHPNGETSVLEGGHMENPEDVQKYLSRERDAIVLDEGSTFDPQPLLELSTRARSTKPQVAVFARKLYHLPAYADVPRGGAVFWVLSNPGGPAAPMIRDFFIDHEPNMDEYPQLAGVDSDGLPLYDPTEWGYIPGNLEDNPYLPKSYERDLAVLQPWRYQQLRWNNWDVVAGQFFGEFDGRIHVKDIGTPGAESQWFRSYDYGYVEPGCCLWWAVLPDGRLYIRREYKHQGVNIAEISRVMRVLTRELHIPRTSYTVGDRFSLGMRKSDDEGETRGEAFGACGIPMTPANHDRLQGWTRVRELLALRADGLPMVIIHPDCRYLIRTLAAAISDKHNPDDVSKNIDDHALSALRYGAMSRPSPLRLSKPPLPRNAVGHLLEEARQNAQPSSRGAWR